MKRGPKTGKAAEGRRRRSVAEDLGDCPAELIGAGRDLWIDAVAHWKQTGQSFRVYRHALVLVCRLLESNQSGLNYVDSARRWLHELGLTPVTADGDTGVAPSEETNETGRTRVLSLIGRKHAG